MMECLVNIVGITESDCNCIVQGLTTDEIASLRPSTSGLFLDDLPGGVHLKSLNPGAPCKKMAAFAVGARNNAIQRLQDDLVVALNTRYKKDKTNFIGNIGRMSYAQSLNLSRNIQGIRITPNGPTDAVMTASRVQVIFNAAVTVTIKLLQVPTGSVMGTELGSWPVTTTANGYTTVNIGVPLKLPLLVNGEQMDYYFVYDITEPALPFQPKDNGIQCTGCSGNIAPFSDYVTVKGVQLNDTSMLNDVITDAYSHGIILDVDIRCDNEKLFCRGYTEDDAVAITMAYCVWYKAGELLIEDVLKQPDVDRYTTMAREYLWGKRNAFRKEYDTRMLYLGAAIDVNASNCYVCRETTNQPFVAPILV
jgi:hypothetical protein